MADVRLTATNPDDSTVVPVACNAKGELKLEEIPTFDGNVDGDLTVSGTASFAGQLVAGEVGNDKQYFRWRSSDGITTNTGRADANEIVYQAYSAVGGSLDQKIEFKADGSAEFSGVVSVDRTVGGNGCFHARLDGNTNATINADGTASFAGGVDVGSDANRVGNIWGYQVYGGGNANGLAIYNDKLHTTPGAPYVVRAQVQGLGDTVDIRTDGSAAFAGNIKVGDFEADGSQKGVWIRESGTVQVSQPGASVNAFQVLKGGSGETVAIKSDGKAVFSGEVTVTSRGQKWVLTEQGGICYMMAPSTREEFDEGFSQSPPRDIIKELDQLKELVQTLINSRNETD